MAWKNAFTNVNGEVRALVISSFTPRTVPALLLRWRPFNASFDEFILRFV